MTSPATCYKDVHRLHATRMYTGYMLQGCTPAACYKEPPAPRYSSTSTLLAFKETEKLHHQGSTTSPPGRQGSSPSTPPPPPPTSQPSGRQGSPQPLQRMRRPMRAMLQHAMARCVAAQRCVNVTLELPSKSKAPKAAMEGTPWLPVAAAQPKEHEQSLRQRLQGRFMAIRPRTGGREHLFGQCDPTYQCQGLCTAQAGL